MQGKFAENLISPSAADRLLAAHDGDLALLYLFQQRTGCRDLDRAAGELCRTMAEMQSAWEKLQRMGLVDSGRNCSVDERHAQPKLSPADELPEYTAEDVVRRSHDDPAFSAILAEAQRVLGHRLSTPDLKKLFGIYDYLALPPELIMVLLNHCVSISKGRLPSMRFIEKEAYAWVNREILTLEQAEEYISFSKQRREDSARVAETLNIRGRALSPTESKYISAWLDMGFGLDVIELAYDRTVTNTGALKWSYMNRILESWREKGLSTVREIEEKDSRRRQPQQTPVQPDKPMDMDRLKAMLDKI